MVAQAFQPVQAQAKACGYRINYLFERNLVLESMNTGQVYGRLTSLFSRLALSGDFR
jgi:hypothetical protein